MTRLIDADTLPRHGKRGGVVHWHDIEKAPTIDAIPIEWIEKYVESCHGMFKEDMRWIEIMVSWWKAEQEKTVDAVNQKLIEVANASGKNWFNGEEQEKQNE